MKSLHAGRRNAHLLSGALVVHPGPMQHSVDPDDWTAHARLIAATLGLGGFLANFDVTSVVVVMPAIGNDLGVPVGGLAWIIDAYSLAFTATLLVAGALADRFGRRRTLLVGNAWFLLASLACGLAWNAPSFLAARAAQGGGAAFLVTGTFALFATAFPAPAARARAFGIVGVVSGVAMALGPSGGGLIGSSLGWRWIFLANLPFCVLLALAVPHLVGEARDGAERPLDWPGVAVLTLALGLMIDAILEVHHAPARAVVGFTAGVGLVAVFAVRQRRQTRPMFDPTVFASRAMAGVTALLLAVSVGYWAVLAVLPLFLGAGLGWTARDAGLALLAATMPMVFIPPFGGHLASRLGWRRLFAAALTLIAAGGCALAIATLTDPPARVLTWAFAGMVLIGTGAALSHPQLSGAVMALAPPQASGMASALTVVARQTGFAMGVAALGALTPTDLRVAGFMWPFGFAALTSACGGLACLLLPGSTSKERKG